MRDWWRSLVKRPRFEFWSGVLCGCLAIVAARFVINHTAVVDWLVAPLSMTDTPGYADAIVVLGAGVVVGCVPNQNAVQRVLLSARLWKEGRAPFILFTGGTGDSCPVATAMARLAGELGIPESNIRIELGSRTTRENGERSADLLRRMGVRTTLVVTDAPHMRRAAGTFERLGFAVERASVPIYVYAGLGDNVWLLRAGAREFTALVYYRIRGWVR
jgi:uncharacterized SAM-binding protein YcdF (DUF218 family)